MSVVRPASLTAAAMCTEPRSREQIKQLGEASIPLVVKEPKRRGRARKEPSNQVEAMRRRLGLRNTELEVNRMAKAMVYLLKAAEVEPIKG